MGMIAVGCGDCDPSDPDDSVPELWWSEPIEDSNFSKRIGSDLITGGVDGDVSDVGFRIGESYRFDDTVLEGILSPIADLPCVFICFLIELAWQ